MSLIGHLALMVSGVDDTGASTFSSLDGAGKYGMLPVLQQPSITYGF